MLVLNPVLSTFPPEVVLVATIEILENMEVLKKYLCVAPITPVLLTKTDSSFSPENKFEELVSISKSIELKPPIPNTENVPAFLVGKFNFIVIS